MIRLIKNVENQKSNPSDDRCKHCGCATTEIISKQRRCGDEESTLYLKCKQCLLIKPYYRSNNIMPSRDKNTP